MRIIVSTPYTSPDIALPTVALSNVSKPTLRRYTPGSGPPPVELVLVRGNPAPADTPSSPASLIALLECANAECKPAALTSPCGRWLDGSHGKLMRCAWLPVGGEGMSRLTVVVD